MQAGKKTIFTLAVAILACAALYGVMVTEEEEAEAAAEAEESPSPEPEAPSGVREPDYLVFLAKAGLLLRPENPQNGEYALAAGEEAPAYPLTVFLGEDGRVGGFVLELPAIREPAEANPDSAVDRAVRSRADALLAEEQAALSALLPPLLEGAAEPGELPAVARDRWVEASRNARETAPEPDTHGAWIFTVEIHGDGSLAAALSRADEAPAGEAAP